MTTQRLERIRTLNAAGWNDQRIAQAIGLPPTAVYYWRHDKLRLPPNRAGARRMPYSDYTFYDRKGNVRAFGSAQQCARALGIQITSVYTLACRSARNGDGRVVRESREIAHTTASGGRHVP